ncbi:hypothetical protein GCM10010326_18780 [Streptomyces xanthochromogenes]|uniref:Beta-lactamase-related domain-containing protein n=2 Tax=Streptomyces xanthochromogenes TaxID=67384 RepID=A0ABQ2ZWA6_9ACTN|nr:hypothetical protein GCM10010326_18780 [Streptomyces xanthochromogenes]
MPYDGCPDGAGMTRTRTAILCAAALVAATLQTTATSASPRPEQRCASTEGRPRGEARRVMDIVRRAQRDLGLKAALVRVTVDGREVVTGAVGESMAGVPATADMHFRVGSVGIAYMGTVLLQLVDEHRVGLDDPVGRWLPDLPHGDEITLRMLADTTSGLHDYVSDPDFLKAVYARPFRQWTPADLLAFPLRHSLWYRPGTNWSYSHANFLLLGLALEKITGTSLDHLLHERVMGPLHLTGTRNGFTPQIPEPVLHSYDAERGTYEESTYWNPSWSTTPGAVLTSDICDLARSAEAIGSGELLSPQAYRTLVNPGTVGLPGPTPTCPAGACEPQTEAFHYGIGVLVKNGWLFQNPSLSGFAAVQAYLPSARLAIAVSTTLEPNAAPGNTAETVANELAKALAPGNPLDA